MRPGKWVINMDIYKITAYGERGIAPNLILREYKML